MLAPKVLAFKRRKGWSWSQLATAIGDKRGAAQNFVQKSAVMTLPVLARILPKMRAFVEREEQREVQGVAEDLVTTVSEWMEQQGRRHALEA